MSLSILFHGAEDGSDGPFALASASGWELVSQWPGTRSAPELTEFVDKGEAANTAALSEALHAALQKYPPKNRDLWDTLKGFAEVLGVGDPKEHATIVGDDYEEEQAEEGEAQMGGTPPISETEGDVNFAAQRAPAGGVSIHGKFYRGGMWIPGAVVASATPQEKAKIGGQATQPQGKQAKGKTAPAPKPNVNDTVASIKKTIASGGDVHDLVGHLMKLTVKDITAVKNALGLKASGTKAVFAKKVAERALASIKVAPKKGAASGPKQPAGKPAKTPAKPAAGAGAQRPGNQRAAQPAPPSGPSVAPKAAGSPVPANGQGGQSVSEPAGPKAAPRIPANVESVNKHIDRYVNTLRNKARGQANGNIAHQMNRAADWLNELKAHVNAHGTDATLKALGEEVVGAGEDVQYGGWAEIDDFTKAYLDRNGISTFEGTPTGERRAIHAVSHGEAKHETQARSGPGSERDVVPIPPQALKNKLEESKHLPGLESTEDLGVIAGQELGSEVRNFTPALVERLDAKYGRGAWIVKTYGKEAFGGSGIYFPQKAARIQQDAQNTIWNAGEILSRFGFQLGRDPKTGKVIGLQHEGGDVYQFGTPEYENTIHGEARKWGDLAESAADSEHGAELIGGPFMAQPAFPSLQSDENKAKGLTHEGTGEARIHITTRNGKAEIIPHSVWIKGNAFPVVLEDEHTKQIAQAALAAVNALPESERQGQLYGPDIMPTQQGWKVVEVNGVDKTGASGYLQDNPFIMDAYVAHITGREPEHVRLARKILSKRGAAGGPAI